MLRALATSATSVGPSTGTATSRRPAARECAASAVCRRGRARRRAIAALTAMAMAAAMPSASSTRRTSLSASAVASARRCTRMMPPASVGRPSTSTVPPAISSRADTERPASRACCRDGVMAWRARGLVDVMAPRCVTLADSTPSPPRVRTARFWLTRAASPASARTAAASAMRDRVRRADSSADDRVSPTASSPASSAVRTAMPTASSVMRPDSDARHEPPPSRRGAGSCAEPSPRQSSGGSVMASPLTQQRRWEGWPARRHTRRSARCGWGSRRRAWPAPARRGRRRCARPRSRRSPRRR